MNDYHQRFRERFPDITHIGCTGELPCATAKNDILAFIEEVLAEERMTFLGEDSELVEIGRAKERKALIEHIELTRERHESGDGCKFDDALRNLLVYLHSGEEKIDGAEAKRLWQKREDRFLPRPESPKETEWVPTGEYTTHGDVRVALTRLAKEASLLPKETECCEDVLE